MQLIGNLIALFPGPHRFSANQPVQRDEPRSRLCEIIWLEPSLFGSSSIPPTPFTLLTEAFYKQSATGDNKLSPGHFGEQFLIQSPAIDTETIKPKPGDHFQIADAKLIILYAPSPSTFQVAISEEGMIEPGAAIIYLPA